MRAKAKIMGGAVVLLFMAITFLPAQVAYAGAYDYLRNKVNAASAYVTNSSRYQTYVSPIVNSVSGQVANLGKYTGLWGVKPSLMPLNRSTLNKMFEVNPDPENGPLLRERKNSLGGSGSASSMMTSRTEYAVTNTSTNKTIKINESVFRSLVKNNRPKID